MSMLINLAMPQQRQKDRGIECFYMILINTCQIHRTKFHRELPKSIKTHKAAQAVTVWQKRPLQRVSISYTSPPVTQTRTKTLQIQNIPDSSTDIQPNDRPRKLTYNEFQANLKTTSFNSIILEALREMLSYSSDNYCRGTKIRTLSS